MKLVRLTQILCITLILSCVTNVYAQQNQALNLDHSSGRRIGDFYKTLIKGGATGFGIGYVNAAFFNSLYFNNINDKIIESKGGYEIVYFIHIAPVMLDIAYFDSFFGVNSDMFYHDYPKKTTSLNGLETYISYAPLLPDWGIISEIVMPYMGIGYQTSSLRVKLDTSDNENPTVGSYGTSSMMWKGGLRLSLKHFFVSGEYKQSLKVSEPEAFRLFSITAGFKF